jgi:hypothetical protein
MGEEMNITTKAKGYATLAASSLSGFVGYIELDKAMDHLAAEQAKLALNPTYSMVPYKQDNTMQYVAYGLGLLTTALSLNTVIALRKDMQEAYGANWKQYKVTGSFAARHPIIGTFLPLVSGINGVMADFTNYTKKKPTTKSCMSRS